MLVTGLISTQTEAKAFNLIYDSVNSVNGVSFVYDLELAPGETLYNLTDSPNSFADVLNFTDLAGVTNVTTSGIYSAIFDSTTVNL